MGPPQAKNGPWFSPPRAGVKWRTFSAETGKHNGFTKRNFSFFCFWDSPERAKITAGVISPSSDLEILLDSRQ